MEIYKFETLKGGIPSPFQRQLIGEATPGCVAPLHLLIKIAHELLAQW